jgi:hypothetical protein
MNAVVGAPLLLRKGSTVLQSVQNLVFLRGFSEDSFASLINRARARMAYLGLLRSGGPGIVEDQSA